MMNKMTRWIKRKGSYLMDWVYNKKPKNKYLKVAYYYITGLISFLFIAFLFFIGFSFVLAVSLQMLEHLEYLIDVNSFFRITFLLLVFVFLSLIVLLIGYSMFKDD